MLTAQDAQHWAEVLAHYDLGQVLSLDAGGGTAAPKVWVTAAQGRYLLRSRRPAASSARGFTSSASAATLAL